MSASALAGKRRHAKQQVGALFRGTWHRLKPRLTLIARRLPVRAAKRLPRLTRFYEAILISLVE